MTEEHARMSFFDHLEELRKCLLKAVLGTMVGVGVCLAFSAEIYRVLAKPLLKLLPEGTNMVFTAPQDPFFVYLKVAFTAGIFVALPWVLFQLWIFISPGLYEREKKLAAPFVAIASLLFYIGGAFAYFLVFPVVFQFFLSLSDEFMSPMISIKEYMSLILKLMLAFGAVFETPVVIVFLGLLGVIDSDFLKKGRRYFIVMAFVLGAILSPPDPLSQLLMGVPLMVLYEISIRVLVVIEKRRKQRDKELGLDLDDEIEGPETEKK